MPALLMFWTALWLIFPIETWANLKPTKQMPLSKQVSSQALDQVDSEVVVQRLKSFSVLISNAKTENERASFLLARAALYIQLAQRDLKKDKELAEANLAKAEADTQHVLSLSEPSPEHKGNAYYLEGLVYLSRDDENGASKRIERSLEEKMSKSYFEAALFFVVDHYYSQNEFSKPLTLLRTYTPQLEGLSQVRAQYKTAWCFVGLGDLPGAEDEVLKILDTPYEKELGESLVKDLSYISAQYRSPDDLLILADRVFSKSPERKVQFLTEAYKQMQRLRPGENNRIILSALLKLKPKTEDRVQLWLEEMKLYKKGYASRRPMEGFTSLQAEIGTMKVPEFNSALRPLVREIQQEAEELSDAFLRTYQSKSDDVESIPKAELVDRLSNVFRFLTTYFPKSQNRIKTYVLWSDMCAEQKDPNCLSQVSSAVLADSKAKQLHKKAKTDRILAYSELVKVDRQAYLPRLIDLLEEQVVDQTSENWKNYASFLADIYLQEQQYDQAILHLSAINFRFPSEEDFYRLQKTRFIAGKLADVVRAKRHHSIEETPRLKELVRDASLKLAAKSTENPTEFTDYEENISRYLALSESSEQYDVVLRDYLSKLVERKDYLRAQVRLSQLPPAKRKGIFNDLTREVIVQLLSEGSFSEALPLTSDPDGNFRTLDGLLYESVIARLALKQSVGLPELEALAAEQFSYIGGLTSVTDPNWFMTLFSQIKEPSPTWLKGAQVAMKIAPATRNIGHVSGRTVASLVEVDRSKLQSLQIQLKRIGFEGKGPDSKLNKRFSLEKSVPLVRELRKSAPDLLQGQGLKAQSYILKTLIALEKAVASFIENAPEPPGLSKADLEKFKQSVRELAQEFHQQAKEFETLLSTLAKGPGREKGQENDQENSEEEGVELATFEKPYPWPETEATKAIVKLVNQKNLVAAMIVADLNRKKMTQAQYYSLRSGILLMGFRNQFIYDVVVSELKSVQMMEVLEQWKSLSN